MDSSDTDDVKSFKCSFKDCKVVYSREWKLKDHIKKHADERPFICDIQGCNKTYTNASHLKRHKCTAHEKNPKILCCHENCNAVFYNQYSLKKHYNMKHNNTPYAFPCPECNQGFDKKKLLQQHFYLHSGEAPFKCPTCNIGFNTIVEYKKHKRNHKTYTCDCGKVFERWTLICAHKRNSCLHKKEFICNICNKIFSTKTNLKQHGLTHVKREETFTCPYGCGRQYLQKKNLNHHINVFHKKIERKVTCTFPNCEKVLNSNKNLKQHIIKVHTNKTKKSFRLQRKDKGIPKKSMVTVLTGIPYQISNETSPLIDYKEEESHDLDHLKNAILKGEEERSSVAIVNIVRNAFNQDEIVKYEDIDDVLINECDKVLNSLQQTLLNNINMTKNIC